MHYLDLVLQVRPHLSLTGLRDPERILDVLIVESLDFCRPDLIPAAGRVLDLGTGAGVPGMTLAVWGADRHLTLLDRTQKKIAFVRRAALALGLHNCHPAGAPLKNCPAAYRPERTFRCRRGARRWFHYAPHAASPGPCCARTENSYCANRRPLPDHQEAEALAGLSRLGRHTDAPTTRKRLHAMGPAGHRAGHGHQLKIESFPRGPVPWIEIQSNVSPSDIWLTFGRTVIPLFHMNLVSIYGGLANALRNSHVFLAATIGRGSRGYGTTWGSTARNFSSVSNRCPVMTPKRTLKVRRVELITRLPGPSTRKPNSGCMVGYWRT